MKTWTVELKEKNDIVSRVNTLDAESAINVAYMMAQLKDDGMRITMKTVKDINTPMGFKIVGNKFVCPRCGYVFDEAKRCPDCGQLLKVEFNPVGEQKYPI